MIFNPLFLTESSTGQILVPKSNKLSNNKYLFSDIVKVVMNPVEGPKKTLSKSDNVIGSNVGLTLENNQTPIKLKLKFLSDSDSEQAKLELAEILPNEIAQLLINDQENLSDDKAVSYISKELLKGELQSFVNNLVGAELIEKNISNESGLLLSLEDKKSAVNLELAKESSSKSIGDKIVVQTLVVPEKAKLISFVGGNNNNNPLFNFNNSSINETSSTGKKGLVNNSNTEITRPTLSVYSFNYGKNPIESLTKNISSNSGQKHNLSLISNKGLVDLNMKTKKVPLEKISFIPSELKKEPLDGKQTTNGQNLTLASKSGELKLFKNNLPKVDKNFSVNKITIVKKKGDTATTENLKNKTNSVTKELEPSLKRIDFSKGNSDSKLLNSLSKNKDLSNVEYIKNTDSKTPKLVDIKQSQAIKLTTEPNTKELTSDTEITSKMSSTRDENKTVTIQGKTKPGEKSALELRKAEDTKLSELKNEKVELKKVVNDSSKHDNIIEKGLKAENPNKNSGSKELIQSVINPNTVEAISVNENKKVSVKVKGGIKSISNKSQSKSTVFSENVLKDNTLNNSSESSENNNFNSSNSSSNNSSLLHNNLNFKSDPENVFNQVLTKEEVSTLGPLSDKSNEIESQSNQKMIKSVEVIKEITRFISKQEKGSLSFDINPEKLGKMKITLDTTDHVIRARIEVDNEQAKQLIERNLDKLHQELSENGLELNSLNISLGYSKQQKEEKEVIDKSQKESQNLGQMGETEEETQKKTLGYNTYEYIA